MNPDGLGGGGVGVRVAGSIDVNKNSSVGIQFTHTGDSVEASTGFGGNGTETKAGVFFRSKIKLF